MIKKLICTFLIAVMLTGLLVGCGQATEKSKESETSKASESTGSSAEKEAEKEADKEPIILTWYMPKANAKMAQEEDVEEAINKVLLEETGAMIDFRFLDGGVYDERMNVMIQAGDEFDICYTCSWQNPFYNNAVRGAFYDISDLLDTVAPDIKAKILPDAWRAVTVNGGIYAIPGQTPWGGASSIVLKKDLVEKYDFDYKSVKTVNDLEPFLQAVKENESGITPVINLYDFVSERYTDQTVKGLVFDEEKQEFVMMLDTDYFLDFYKTMNEWYQKGYIPKDILALSGGNDDKKSGKYAVMRGTGSYSESGEKSSQLFGFDCVEIYCGDSYATNDGVINAMNAISATSKNPEKALEVLNVIWKNDWVMNTIGYGIEGINYTVDTERSTSEMKSVIPKSGDQQTWAVWHNWIGPLWDQWDSSWNRKEALEEMEAKNAAMQFASSFGFYFDSSAVSTEVASVSAIVTEITPILESGSMPDFDEYISEAKAKLAAAGLEKIQKEVNAQFAAWKAAQ